jgi:hypothetical protein
VRDEGWAKVRQEIVTRTRIASDEQSSGAKERRRARGKTARGRQTRARGRRGGGGRQRMRGARAEWHNDSHVTHTRKNARRFFAPEADLRLLVGLYDRDVTSAPIHAALDGLFLSFFLWLVCPTSLPSCSLARLACLLARKQSEVSEQRKTHRNRKSSRAWPRRVSTTAAAKKARKANSQKV